MSWALSMDGRYLEIKFLSTTSHPGRGGGSGYRGKLPKQPAADSKAPQVSRTEVLVYPRLREATPMRCAPLQEKMLSVMSHPARGGSGYRGKMPKQPTTDSKSCLARERIASPMPEQLVEMTRM